MKNDLSGIVEIHMKIRKNTGLCTVSPKIISTRVYILTKECIE